MKKFKKKILIITTSRSDYGLLKPLIVKLKNSKKYLCQLIVTGTHLSKKHGMTIQEIKKENVKIFKKINITKIKDNNLAISSTLSNGIKKISLVLNNSKPNLIILLGDKYETLAAAIAATCSRIPIAHIHGGEITKGAIDDSIRHCITKLSHLHFASSLNSMKNIIQMGESKKRVYNVGALGVDAIKNTEIVKKHYIEKKLNLKFLKKNILITFNPETINANKAKEHIDIILKSLAEIKKDTLLIFTMSNADHENQIIKEKIIKFIKNNKNAYFFYSLGSKLYYNVMRHCNLILGNSSSGILEAPYLKVSTIDIGIRQKGRDYSRSVFKSDFNKEKIIKLINYITFNRKKIKFDFLYGKGGAANKIIKVLNKTNINNLFEKDFNKVRFL